MTDTNTVPNVDGAAESAPAIGQPIVSPQAPVYIVQQAPVSKKGFGVTSMVLGISAVIFSWTSVFAFILLIAAFIFGAVSLKKKELPRGFAITGMILGSAAVLLAIVFTVIIAMAAGALGMLNN